MENNKSYLIIRNEIKQLLKEGKKNKNILGGIYCIFNFDKTKIYIGSSEDFYRRFKEHKDMLKANNHHCDYLQNSYKKNATEDTPFCFEILEYISNVNLLEQIEQKYLDKNYDNQENCYNSCPTAGNRRGWKMSDDTKGKISKGNKGKKRSKETKELLSEIAKERIQTHFLSGEGNIMFGKTGSSHHGAKKVYQICPKTFEIINCFGSYKEAADFIKSEQCFISRAVKKKYKVNGYLFITENDLNENPNLSEFYKKKKRIFSKEARENISKARKLLGISTFEGKNHSDFSKRKISLTKMPKDKKIYELDRNNNVINIFECIFDITKKYELDGKKISAVLRDKRKTIDGKKFEYR